MANVKLDRAFARAISRPRIDELPRKNGADVRCALSPLGIRRLRTGSSEQAARMVAPPVELYMRHERGCR